MPDPVRGKERAKERGRGTTSRAASFTDDGKPGHFEKSVVIATSYDDYFIFFHLIYQTVFTVNSAGPATGKLKPEWFWLASSLKRSTANFFKKRENTVG